MTFHPGTAFTNPGHGLEFPPTAKRLIRKVGRTILFLAAAASVQRGTHILVIHQYAR